MSSKNDMTDQLSFRTTPESNQRLGELAAFHGRTRSEELRLALAVHDARSVIAYFDTAEAALELGDKLEAARREVEADLTALEEVVYRRRRLAIH